MTDRIMFRARANENTISIQTYAPRIAFYNPPILNAFGLLFPTTSNLPHIDWVRETLINSVYRFY